MVMNKFTDEAAVAQTLKTNSPKAGIYYMPHDEKDYGPGKVVAFVNVKPEGMSMNMGKLMINGVVIQLISAFIVLSMLAKTTGLSYAGKVGFFALTGLAIGFIGHAPYWNWFDFPSAYVIVIILDTIFGWTLAGLVVAKLARG